MKNPDIKRNLINPLCKSTGINLIGEKFRQTRKAEWPDMTPEQKLGAVAATAVSFGRLFWEGVKLGKPDSERGWKDTIGDVIFAASDGLDGMIARKTGGKTAFGGVADQLLGDKFARWTKEISMAQRGRISPIHPAVRILRDLYVTYQRDKITDETDGAISVDAASRNNPLSGKYSTVTYLIINALLDSQLGKEMPRWLRESLATVTDVHLAVTGIATVMQLRAEQAKTGRLARTEAIRRRNNLENNESNNIQQMLALQRIIPRQTNQ